MRIFFMFLHAERDEQQAQNENSTKGGGTRQQDTQPIAFQRQSD